MTAETPPLRPGQCPEVSPAGKRCVRPVGHDRMHDDGERPSPFPEEWGAEDSPPA